MYGPTPQQVAYEQALAEIRHFLRLNTKVGYELRAISWMSRQHGYDPEALTLEAVRQHPRRDQLCSAVTGPWGQLALSALTWEFPQWRPAFGVLQTAAQVYCQEKAQNQRAAAGWAIAIAGIAGMIAIAVSGGRAKPPN